MHRSKEAHLRWASMLVVLLVSSSMKRSKHSKGIHTPTLHLYFKRMHFGIFQKQSYLDVRTISTFSPNKWTKSNNNSDVFTTHSRLLKRLNCGLHCSSEYFRLLSTMSFLANQVYIVSYRLVATSRELNRQSV